MDGATPRIELADLDVETIAVRALSSPKTLPPNPLPQSDNAQRREYPPPTETNITSSVLLSSLELSDTQIYEP